jgi:hypothetical protein
MQAPPPGTVAIWATDLETWTLPRVSVISGRPAEDWVTITYRTAPMEARVVSSAVAAMVATSVRCHLPVTRSEKTSIQLVRWFPRVLVLLVLVSIFGGCAECSLTPPDWSGVGAFLFLLGCLALVPALLLWKFVPDLAVPRATVYETPPYGAKLVELRNVSPAFIQAVEQLHLARHEAYKQSPSPTQPPS